MLGAVKTMTRPLKAAARPYLVPIAVRVIDACRAVPRVARDGANALDERVGRTAFGNTAGVTFNIKGRLHLRSIKRQAALPKASNATADEIRRNGCAYVPGLIDQARLAPVVEAFDKSIEDEQLSVSLTNPFFKDQGVEAIRCVWDAAKAMPQIAPLLDGAITSIVNAYYGTPFMCLLASPYRTYHVAPALAAQKEPMSNRWHCDVRRTDMVKVFILLRDTDDSMGPLHVLPKPDTKEALRRGYRSRDDLGPAAEWMESRAKRLTGRAGDAMFANTTTCMHRAGIPGPGQIPRHG